MEKISLFLFGYRNIYLDSEYVSKAMSLLLKNSISAYWENNALFLIRERDFEKLKGCFSGNIQYTYSECKGIYGYLKGIDNKPGLCAGIILSLILMIFSSMIVWDIRIEGNEKITDSTISSELSEQGLKVGTFWPFINRSRIETGLLDDFEGISWVNVNRRGSVAYISVKEKDIKNEDDEGKANQYKYSNIVAKSDCVIEEISVKRGRAMVAPGDTVKEGDILISGIVELNGEFAFCNAEGVVIGRCSDKVEVYVDRTYLKTTEKNSILSELNLKIFNLNINIFKKYRNLGSGYDIIKNRWVASAPNGVRFPICIDKSYVIESKTEEAVYTDSEIVALAAKRLRAKTAAKLSDSDLLSVKSDGRFEDNGYVMFSDLVFLCDVGVALEFNVE